MGGLPCSGQIWISSGSTGKSREDPRGDITQPCTQLANKLACRFALVALLCLVRQVWWLAEQPGSSVARHLPYLELALAPAMNTLGFAQGIFQKVWFGSCINKPY